MAESRLSWASLGVDVEVACLLRVEDNEEAVDCYETGPEQITDCI